METSGVQFLPLVRYRHFLNLNYEETGPKSSPPEVEFPELTYSCWARELNPGLHGGRQVL